MAMIIDSISGLKEKMCGHCGGNEKVELDLINYGTKADLKGATFMLVSKTDLAGLKTMADKLDVNKLKTVFDDVSKLRNAAETTLSKNCVLTNWLPKLSQTKIGQTSAILLKITLLIGFSRFLHCTNCTKLGKTLHIMI